MKAENLRILTENGINVPPFEVVDIGQKVSRRLRADALYAVRSSFANEDSEEASFAGQFQTFLNVPGDRVEEYVERVRESGQNAGAAEYARVKHSSLQGSSQPVIIQEMVQADYSGVLFTANPMGILNEMVIVAGFGLGSRVVEDKTDTSSYYYNCDDGVYCSSINENTPKLTDTMIRQLIETGSRIRQIFKEEMDIEYCVKGDKLFILQARPITTLEKGERIILDNSNIVESYPHVTLPLTQSFVRRIYTRVFQSCVYRISRDEGLVRRMDGYLQNMTDVADGRMYYRISSWYAILKMLPFSGKIITIWQNMLGVSNKYVDSVEIRVGVFRKLWIMASFGYNLLRSPAHMKKLNAFFAEKYPEYRRSLEKAGDMEQLLELYENLLEALSSRWDITLINDMYAFIFTALAGKNNKEAIAHIRNLESMKPVLKMEELMETARRHGLYSQAYQRAAAAYVEEYGDRCLNELKLETPTYRTNPEFLEEYVKRNLLEKDDSRERNQNKETVKEADEDGNPFVKRAKLGIYHREISRMNRTRIFGLARGILLKAGGLMEEQGLLEDKRDVFYLFYEELKAYANAKECDGTACQALIRQRKAEFANYAKLPTFSRLVYAGRVINHDIFCTRHSALFQGDRLQGIPSSVGEVQGEVLVIENPNQNIDTRDKIIVTKMTDPGWVFLIRNAKGIIAEKGSLLSHTAIIARELNKPAVVNVKDATRILKTGDLVRLDAVHGVIYRLDAD